MPKFTSIRSLGNAYYLKLFPKLTELFGGDSCCSAIVSALDFLGTASGELQDAAGEQEGLLWVRVTLDKLAERMDHLYSIRRIQDRLAFLVNHGLVLMPKGQDLYTKKLQANLTFLLNTKGVDELLTNQNFLPFTEPKVLPPATNIAATTDVVSATNVAAVVTNVAKPVTNVAAIKEENRSLDKTNTENLSLSLQEPKQLLLVSPEEYPVEPQINFPKVWNDLVPEAPVRWNWVKDKPHKDWEDPEFKLGFQEICKKASAIHQARGDQVKWLTFRNLFTKSPQTKLPKWRTLLVGDYDCLLYGFSEKPTNEVVYKKYEDLFPEG